MARFMDIETILQEDARSITRRSGSSFYYPMMLFPGGKREAIFTVYAFCRITDDIVDQNGSDAATHLSVWKKELIAAERGHSSYYLLNRVMRVARDFSIPVQLFHDVIRGMEMDLERREYRTFDELYEYCYCVASAVGLMIIRILGAHHTASERFALHAGLALQLTNTIRDAASDIAAGRIYFPVTDRRAFFDNPSAVQDALRLQCAEARKQFQLADEAFRAYPSLALFPARVMENMYRLLLDKIEQTGFTPTAHRVSLTLSEKIQTAGRTWFDDRPYRG